MESNQKVNKRILVLGSALHSRTITAYTWDNLPKIFNIADYDMVILNMVPFLKKSFAHTYIEKTYFPLEQFARLLFSEGSEVIAIGVPEIETSGGVTRNLMGWLPKQLEGEPFPDNCINAAQRFELCLMTTTQLFHALCAHQGGELDLAEFWDTIFNTSGVCTLPELEAAE